MNRPVAVSLEALVAVAAVAWATERLLPVLGLASSALLFLLPVLLASARGGLAPGLVTALAGAAAYNFFLLEPRFTFRVHELDNLVSVFVLGAVAVVTSRLASRLKAREAEALERARTSEQAAELSAVLAAGTPAAALDEGLALVARRYGTVRLLADGEPPDDAAFSSIDRAAAAWALHNGDCTGHGTQVMPAADWTFVPLAPKARRGSGVAAFARPAAGATRSEDELDQLRQVGLALGQARDRVVLEDERRERERLEERDALRRALLASLAHDFRTPLTVVIGRLELLARTQPEAQEALAAARRLDRRMTDLLGAARLEAGALAPTLEAVDLVDAVAAACDGIDLPAGVALHRTIPADVPFVSADPVLLHHVLANLLDNALRHARAEVAIAAARTGDGVRLTVSDDGPGVPPDQRDAVFERFARGASGPAPADRSGGSGLGLAIVRGFAEAMGMTVTVETADSGGACFVLAMPVAPGAAS